MTAIAILLAGLAPVINEICYDPPGPDAGAEFVEIFNPDTVAVSLAGYRLAFANGAGEVSWQDRWTGPPGATLAAGGCYLIVDRGWQGPAAQAEVALGLQNGPDALCLERADGSRDVVGWGEPLDPELREGAPAPDPSGQSLARRPDGHDTQDNAADFIVAEPTPGGLNWPAFAPRLERWSWQPPALAAAGKPLRSCLLLRNAGREDLGGTRLRLRVGTDSVAVVLAAVAPDSAITVELDLSVSGAGALPAALAAWRAAPAPPESLAWQLGRVQVGPAGVRIAEVMAAPATGGEWCELVNADVVPRNLADLSLRDEDGAWRSLPDLVLAPGDCRLVAQDAAATAAWLAELAGAGVVLPCEPAAPVAADSWPSLNNTAPDSRDFADRLYLADAEGTVIDFVTLGLGSGRAPAGRSLERSALGDWRPATAPAGATPGCPPLAVPGLREAEVTLSPNPFSPASGDGALHVLLEVPTAASGYELRIYDLWGRGLRDLGGDDLGAGPRDVVWDGRDDAGRLLPAGGYVVLVQWRAREGGLQVGARRLVVIRESGR